MKEYFIESKRLGFSRWNEDGLQNAIGLWGDYDVTKFIDARGKLSDEQVRERLHREIELDKKYGVQYWPILLTK